MAYNARILDLRDGGKAETVLKALAAHPSAFTAWRQTCQENCGKCAACVTTEEAVVQGLLRPDARVWEVTNGAGPVAPVGILRLSRIKPGEEAVLDFIFFDHRMSDKQPIIRELIQNALSEQEGWPALKRLTAEVPAKSFKVIRIFSKLGFGGDFEMKHMGLKFKVEAVIPTANEAVGSLVIMSRKVA